MVDKLPTYKMEDFREFLEELDLLEQDLGPELSRAQDAAKTDWDRGDLRSDMSWDECRDAVKDRFAFEIFIQLVHNIYQSDDEELKALMETEEFPFEETYLELESRALLDNAVVILGRRYGFRIQGGLLRPRTYRMATEPEDEGVEIVDELPTFEAEDFQEFADKFDVEQEVYRFLDAAHESARGLFADIVEMEGSSIATRDDCRTLVEGQLASKIFAEYVRVLHSSWHGQRIPEVIEAGEPYSRLYSILDWVAHLSSVVSKLGKYYGFFPELALEED